MVHSFEFKRNSILNTPATVSWIDKHDTTLIEMNGKQHGVENCSQLYFRIARATNFEDRVLFCSILLCSVPLFCSTVLFNCSVPSLFSFNCNPVIVPVVHDPQLILFVNSNQLIGTQKASYLCACHSTGLTAQNSQQGRTRPSVPELQGRSAGEPGTFT